MWFARFVNGQRVKSKRVNETTFYALIQYFAIILFECKDCEDFLPARHLMSLCFTFYQEGELIRTFFRPFLFKLFHLIDIDSIIGRISSGKWGKDF